jgi:hypothetical protein
VALTPREVINLKQPDILKGTDAVGIETWIDNYCASNPLNTLMTATTVLVTVLRKNAAGRY